MRDMDGGLLGARIPGWIAQRPGSWTVALPATSVLAHQKGVLRVRSTSEASNGMRIGLKGKKPVSPFDLEMRAVSACTADQRGSGLVELNHEVEFQRVVVPVSGLVRGAGVVLAILRVSFHVHSIKFYALSGCGSEAGSFPPHQGRRD